MNFTNSAPGMVTGERPDTGFWDLSRMKHLGRILCLCILAGCSRRPSSPDAPIVISGDQVSQLIESKGAFGVSLIADAQYSVPTVSWFVDQFPSEWLDFSKVLTPYVPEARDCDDFARGAAFLAQLLHSMTPNRPRDSALAVGEFWYERADGQGHAIDVAICRQDGSTNLSIVFFEPQTAQIVTLTENEFTSCSAYRF